MTNWHQVPSLCTFLSGLQMTPLVTFLTLQFVESWKLGQDVGSKILQVSPLPLSRVAGSKGDRKLTLEAAGLGVVLGLMSSPKTSRADLSRMGRSGLPCKGPGQCLPNSSMPEHRLCIEAIAMPSNHRSVPRKRAG